MRKHIDLITESNHCNTKFDDIEGECPECGMDKEWHRGLDAETMERGRKFAADEDARTALFTKRAAQKTLARVAADEKLNEALRPTATRDKTDTAFDIPIDADTSHQQVVPAGPAAAPPVDVRPDHVKAAATRNAMANARMPANTGNIMRDLANNLHQLPADEISDAEAAANAGHGIEDYVDALGYQGAAELGAPVDTPLLTAGVDEVVLNPDNLPKVITSQLMASGDPNIEDTFDPEWHQIKHLPGYLQTMIRSLARRVFSRFTQTPIEDIQMMCEILNNPRDVQKMATWIVKHGHKEDEMTMDFSDIVPGFTADCTLWRAGGVEYMIMRDVGGHYIYAWPETAREIADRAGMPQAEAPQFGQTRRLGFQEGIDPGLAMGEPVDHAGVNEGANTYYAVGYSADSGERGEAFNVRADSDLQATTLAMVHAKAGGHTHLFLETETGKEVFDGLCENRNA